MLGIESTMANGAGNRSGREYPLWLRRGRLRKSVHYRASKEIKFPNGSALSTDFGWAFSGVFHVKPFRIYMLLAMPSNIRTKRISADRQSIVVNKSEEVCGL